MTMYLNSKKSFVRTFIQGKTEVLYETKTKDKLPWIQYFTITLISLELLHSQQKLYNIKMSSNQSSP